MKKSMLFIFILLLSLSSFAQTQAKNDSIRSFDDIKHFFINNYSPNADSVKSNCWRGCVCLRFNINEQHRIVNVAFTKSTPTFIKDGITKVISVINQRGFGIDHLQSKSDRTYLLPVMVNNNAGCGFMTGWENDNNQDKLDQTTKLMYERRQENYDQLVNSLGNITNFTDKDKSAFVDCILLAPIVMPTAVN